MSNLRIVTRALNYSQEWNEVLEAALALSGVEDTRQARVLVTNDLATLMCLDEETLLLDVSGVPDEAVMDAVAAYAASIEPTPKPEPESEPEVEPEEEGGEGEESVEPDSDE